MSQRDSSEWLLDILIGMVVVVGAVNPTSLRCGGLENLSGAGGLQKPPHLLEVLLVPLTQKMVPNHKTRRDKDVTT